MKNLYLVLLMISVSSCYFQDDPTVVDAKSKVEGISTLTKVRVKDHKLIIEGSNFSGVKSVKLKGHGIDESFTITSNNGSKIIAGALNHLNIGLNKVFTLILADAYGASSYQVDFTIPTMNAGDGDVLMFNSGTAAWEPRPLNNVNLLGTWDASTNTPALADGGGGGVVTGDYYVVRTAGAAPLDGINTWNAGDWVMFNGSVWEKISNTSVVASFNGRQGVVVPMEADYLLNQLGDVNTTGAAAGKVLKYNGVSWVVGDDISISGGAVSGTSGNYTGSGSQLTLGHDAVDNTQVTVADGGFTTFSAQGSGTPGFNFTGGNVGVGNITPGEELDVTGDIRASSSVITPSLTSTGDLAITSDSANGAAGALIFNTGPNERMRILNNGNVGIGATTPSSLLSNSNTGMLDSLGWGVSTPGLIWKTNTQGYVAGFENEDATTSGRNGVLIKTAATDNASLALNVETGGISRFAVNGTGNVGIGTAPALSSKLDVAGRLALGTGTNIGDSEIRFRSNGSSANAAWNLSVRGDLGGNNDDFKIVRHVGGTYQDISFQIQNSTGNVGIGTTAPAGKLHVSTTGTNQLVFEDSDQADATAPFWGVQVAGGNFQLWSATRSAGNIGVVSNQVKVLTNGNVGIGTVADPSQKLEVNGNVLAADYYFTSDRRLKMNIDSLSGLDIINQMRGVSYNWRKDGRKDMGVIAQEVEAVAPELVATNPKTGIKSVKYGNIVGPLIQAVKELYAMFVEDRDEQNRKIAALEERNRILEERLLKLESQMAEKAQAVHED